nr:hypothetical protein [Rhodoferax sp.]
MNTCIDKITRIAQNCALVVLVIFALGACGGGGGSSSSAAGGNTLSGTAATGAPIVAGTVTLKDSVGATATTTTDAKGNYSFDVGAKHFPLMLKVQPNVDGAVPLFSAALTLGTANTNPLTTLQVFEAVGRTDPSAIYNSGDFSKIGKSSLDQGKLIVTSNFATQFAANGLNLTTHDPITTPMVANGVGMDAILDQTNVAIIGNGASITDSTGNCTPYGPPNVMTFAIDGMNPTWFIDYSAAGMDEKYVKKALGKICVLGIDQPRPIAPNITNPSVMQSNVTWTRILPILVPDVTDTNNGVIQLITQLKNANLTNKLAIQRGGIAGPINIVAHSWGTVIAYIALTELAVEDPTIQVANLITMGSPIQCLAGGCIKSILIQQSVPEKLQTGQPFRGQPIQVPSNVTTWTNFVNAADPYASKINVTNVKHEPVADCPAPPSSGMAGTTPTVASSCTPHSVYFDVGDAFTIAPTLDLIRLLIATPSSQPPATSTTVSPPLSTTPAPRPLAFSLTAGTPYCDTNSPVVPAVKLTWSTSNGVVNYRVFRNDSAIGVNLAASQLSFQNNLGLVAGQTYNYKVQAMNANGATWSNTAQVTIPAGVCVTFTTATNGACGSSNGATVSSAPSSNLCSTGTAGAVTGSGPWNWSCSGSNGGTNASCSATKLTTTAANGSCGSSNGAALSSAPTANLCSAGTAGSVTGSGPWNWSCSGSNGGTNASCSATKLTTATNGTCGSSNGAIVSSAPSTNLCSAGTAGTVSGSGPWNWSCSGSNGGTNASCSAGTATLTMVAPTLTAPTNNATGQSLTPTLQWSGGTATYWQVNVRNQTTN